MFYRFFFLFRRCTGHCFYTYHRLINTPVPCRNTSTTSIMSFEIRATASPPAVQVLHKHKYYKSIHLNNIYYNIMLNYALARVCVSSNSTSAAGYSSLKRIANNYTATSFMYNIYCIILVYSRSSVDVFESLEIYKEKKKVEHTCTIFNI